MADIKGLHSHNFRSGTETLIAMWHKTPMVYNGTAWIRGGNFTDNKDTYFASFIDHVFMVNGTDENSEYDGVDWRNQNNAYHSPIAKFIVTHSSSPRLFLFNLRINNGGSSVLSYPSRIWYSDLPNNNSVTWGLEYGYDLNTTASSATITSASAKFKTRNIKIGDPFFITQSDVGNTRAKPYVVQSIDSETQLTLTENITYTSTDDIYWVGSNWFDVGTDDGDVGNGLGLASNEIIVLKKNSVYRYNVEGETLRQIKDAPGTTSPKSIVSWGGYCYWYHPSGIYRTSGGVAEKVSNPVEDIIEGVTSANQTAVVGWKNEIDNNVNFFLGDVTLRDGDTISKCVVTLDLNSNIFAPRSYDRNIKVATNWLRSSVSEIYIGDDSDGVFQLDTGTQFKTSDIPFELELYPIFPAGEEATITFTRVRAYIENGPDVQILYKLIYKPKQGFEGVWVNDDTWHSLEGSQIGEKTDWYFPSDARAAGVKLKFVESGGDESFLIEKITIYYSNATNL